jgi:lycopene cyclase domain-containing protein
MTYFAFLLQFILVPILIFLVLYYWDCQNNTQIHGFRNGRAVWVGIGVHVFMAVIYTTPWDNYLVATNVWYYNPSLVTGLVLGYVPIEEYTFFVLETLLAGLCWWFLARHLPAVSARKTTNPNQILVYLSSGLLALLWLLFTWLFFFGAAKWTYLSIILFWALPPIFIQLLFGADILWRYRNLVFWSITIPGTYLSLMDIVALKETTWSISATQTTGILFFGILPLEEVVFFFLTNTLITFGMTLLLANVSQERFAGLRKQVQHWRETRAFRLPSR